MTEIWRTIENFTSQENAYYGQDISRILVSVVPTLLERMQNELNGEEGPEPMEYLTVQINSSYYATEIMDHLISNDVQWDQLINVS